MATVSDCALPAPAADRTTPNLISNPAELTADDRDILDYLTRQADVVVMLKGTPDAPKCKFSRELIGLLPQLGVDAFAHFDVTSDDSVRAGCVSLPRPARSVLSRAVLI